MERHLARVRRLPLTSQEIKTLFVAIADSDQLTKQRMEEMEDASEIMKYRADLFMLEAKLETL
jgi:hypothetical protein